MRVCNLPKPVVLVGIFAVGLAMVMPTPAIGKAAWYDNQHQYAQVLNPLAASVMSWYGHLVESARKRSPEARESVKELFASAEGLSTYRQLYPDRIRTIEILDAGLKRRQPRLFAFRLDARMVYWVANQLREAVISETMIFALALPQRHKIITIERTKTDEATQSASPIARHRGDRLYYQLRQFAYAWLAEMDHSPDHTPFMQDTLDQTIYEVEFGATTFHGDVETTLRKRRAQQGHGGHLLRSLTVVQQPDKTHQLTIALIIDWKGQNPDGLKAIGKLRQEISFVISEDGQLLVRQIREQQLLPDLKPWTKLLC